LPWVSLVLTRRTSFGFLSLATMDAVAVREIADPAKFGGRISKMVDETVEGLNASAWAQDSSQVSHQPCIRLRIKGPSPSASSGQAFSRKRREKWDYLVLFSLIFFHSADFFAPGFQVLFHLGHELVGYGSIDQAMVVA
jgi:hypothetical protein